MGGLLKDSKAFRQPPRDLVVRNVGLPRDACLRPDPRAAETRAGRLLEGFLPAPLADALRLATGGLGAVFLRAAFLGSPASARSMAPATSAIGAMPSTAFKVPCRR